MKVISGNNELHCAAYHEAGHAVAFYLLAHPINSIFVDDYGNGLVKGNVEVPTSKKNLSRKELEKLMNQYGLRCLSGYAAECKYRKINFLKVELISNENQNNDFSRLKNEMLKANEILQDDFFNDFWFYLIKDDVKKIMSRKKVKLVVEELALELIQNERKLISGERAIEILSKHLICGELS
ncbi:MAG: hypothetical protein IPI93_14320 [Sphingobacteriaceae bacterium]|nr:hypothetical protein [Sphingobacteriaceae bacterium]